VHPLRRKTKLWWMVEKSKNDVGSGMKERGKRESAFDNRKQHKRKKE
jgi:hypothetical protein